ncbi:MAG: hypothetical protein GX197_01790 [Firmicutes bacterium]|nr:hypothetical protein [Bacillota bacterium]
MPKNTITRYFAGSNTLYGFYSLFQYITTEKTKRFIMIKGGAGTGKSTLMQKISGKAQEAGLDVELFYCSSDPDSLDGLSIPALGFAIVDGTAPHILDPQVPGAYDEILDLGQYWDTAKLKPYKETIQQLYRQNKNWFTQAYQYLKEAGVVLEKLRWLMGQAMDYRAVDRMTQELLQQLTAALPAPKVNPSERRLFAGAITPSGFINHYPCILQKVKRFYLLTGEPGTGKSYLLERIRQAVKLAGHDLEVFCCPLDPKRLDAIIIPVLKTAFVKVTYPHTFALEPTHRIEEQTTIALNRYAKTSLLKQYAGEREENTERLWYLLGKAVEMLRSAKRNHDHLEKHYIDAMDYSHMAALQDKLLAELFN